MTSASCRFAAVLVFVAAGAFASPESAPLANAIACALVDAGTQVATHVPASGAVEVFDAFCDLSGHPKIYSYNEEASFALAHGAALGGARSVAILKSHGFAKAANAIVDSIVAGTSAGLVLLVFHDAAGVHSDSVLDTLPLVAGTGIRHLSPEPRAAYAEIQRAFLLSEQYQIPVAVVVDSADLSAPVDIDRMPMPPPPRAPFLRDVHRRILCPFLAPYQRRALDARLADLPPPPDKPLLPNVPDDLPPKFKPTALAYQPVFDAFLKVKDPDAVVAGDAGTSALFAFPPYSCIDVVAYYGGSIPLAAGLALAGHSNAWAVCGDFAFVAAAHMGLPEAIQRNLPVKTIVFHNRVAAATGGQPLQPDVFELVLGGYRDFVRRLPSDADSAAILRALSEAHDSPRPEIVVVDVP